MTARGPKSQSHQAESAVVWPIGDTGLLFTHVDRRGDSEARRVREEGTREINRRLRETRAQVRDDVGVRR